MTRDGANGTHPATWARRLGWGHRGFRVESRSRATLGLILLLAPAFLLDQWITQVRIARHRPDLRSWLVIADEVVRKPDQPLYRAAPGGTIPWERLDVAPGWYLYPPFFLVLVWPLSQLPAWAAAAAFETLKWLALFYCLRLAWRLSAPRGEDVPPIVALGSIGLTWRFLWNDLAHQNVNLFLLLAALAGCWMLRRGRDAWAGALVAAAAAVKVTPALLLVYFAYKRRWRALVGAAAAGVACLVALPAAVFGFENNLNLLREWYVAIVQSYLGPGAVDSMHGNLSLTALLNRLFTETRHFDYGVTITIVELPDWARLGIRAALSAAIIGLLAWTCRGRLTPNERGPALAAEVGMVQIAMLILSGISWKAHYVAMLLPNAVLLAYLADARHTRARRAVGGLLGVSAACCLLTGDLITPTGADYAEALGVITLGACAAGVALALVRGALREGIDASPTGPAREAD